MILRQLATKFRTCGRYLHTNNNPDLATAIAELNKEMESVFGDPPPVSNTSPINDLPNMAQVTQFVPQSIGENEQGLTHISNTGEAQMVDVSSKESTKRVAIAGCRVILGKKAFDLVSANQIAKGDVLSVAKIAGITGAKQTSNLIPLCHNINLTHIRVDLTLNEKDFSVEIEGEAASTGKTGVEMEAMTAVTIAGLTVYDMCKAASKDIQITDVRLEHKRGGKSGEWSRKK
ncbi:Molybdopterin cofactor biosynthesis C (MoaC) domain [Macleaya cordata]|uniref:cyclic pyranopterin monophosphate synthase n=1 Tax=Macleaya cordata TaxID=56857 RepID=A0A200Q722_MACCD|nr:Molybdopterin cofactor biosynthesis C (MoaC) domain [Macleaya cordata]